MSNSDAKIRRIVGVIGSNDQISEGHPSLSESSGSRLVCLLEASLQGGESGKYAAKQPTSEVVTIRPA